MALISNGVSITPTNSSHQVFDNPNLITLQYTVKEEKNIIMVDAESKPSYNVSDHLAVLENIARGDMSNEVGILALPNRHKTPQRLLALRLAKFLSPNDSDVAALIQYERLVRPAKKVVWERQKRKAAEELAPRTNKGGQLTKAQGPWAGQEADPVDLRGPKALPMPVSIGSTEEFEPIFNFLAADRLFDEARGKESAERGPQSERFPVRYGLEELHGTPLLEFERGIIYADGRLDLCKKVVGPTHIGRLMNSLRSNHQIRHFLLGNNIISTTGAREISALIEEDPDRMETWYLAGCHITQHALSLLVSAMARSSEITNLWFKRNPFGPASASLLAQLVLQIPSLRTLDLENTELGDVGTAHFIKEITGRASALKHLYLNANGLSVDSCTAIAAYLSHPACVLESLFLSSNPLGDIGIAVLAPALAINKTIKRLTLASTGLTSKAIVSLSSAITPNHPLHTLDLSASQTTKIHGQRYNYLDDSCVAALTKIILLPSMQFLNLGRPFLTPSSVHALSIAVEQSELLFLSMAPLYLPAGDSSRTIRLAKSPGADARLEANVRTRFPHIPSYAAFLKSEELRFIANTSDVRLIDSMYRTRDRRNGLPAPDSSWSDDDETWKLVLRDAEMSLVDGVA